MSDQEVKCSVCDSPLAGEVLKYGALCRISSDSKVFGTGGRLAQCPICGTVQKPNDPIWRAECAAIYESYDSYAVSGGIEQSVRGGSVTGNRFAPRSDLVLEGLCAHGDLPAKGRLLDYGCGRGPTSRAAQRLLAGWQVDGYDLDRRAEAELGALENFDTLFSGPPEKTIEQILASGRRYDLVAMVHVLEHIPRGHEALSSLARLLAPGGRIVVQVPNRILNPFDLLLADHTVHFDSPSLYGVGERSGLSVEMLSEDWVVKELTMLVGPGPALTQPPAQTKISAAAQVAWLAQVGQLCQHTATKRPWGIFGTSNVAAWVREEAGAQPDFYIDEDVAKQGHKIDGVEVLTPKQAPDDAHVLMAMAPQWQTVWQSGLPN